MGTDPEEETRTDSHRGRLCEDTGRRRRRQAQERGLGAKRPALRCVSDSSLQGPEDRIVCCPGSLVWGPLSGAQAAKHKGHQEWECRA